MLKSIILILSITAFGACTQPSTESDGDNQAYDDSAELQELYEQDQADRTGDFDSMDWTVVSRNDSLRRARVHELLDSSLVKTSEDFRHAAMVFQHGSDTTAARLAYDLALQAVELDTSNADAKWLMAAAWDRYQMRKGKPQWYGTQYVNDGPGTPWRLYDIDTTAVSDEQRLALGTRTLSEARARVASMNQE